MVLDNSVADNTQGRQSYTTQNKMATRGWVPWVSRVGVEASSETMVWLSQPQRDWLVRST